MGAGAKSQAFAATQAAEALIAQARAEAETIRLKAEAEAEAIRIKAQAESERAELLSKTPLGSQLALLSVWAETVQKSNEGISKVVYCDPSVQLAAGGGNPLSLLGLSGLPQELQKLTSIGRQGSRRMFLRLSCKIRNSWPWRGAQSILQIRTRGH